MQQTFFWSVSFFIATWAARAVADSSKLKREVRWMSGGWRSRRLLCAVGLAALTSVVVLAESAPALAVVCQNCGGPDPGGGDPPPPPPPPCQNATGSLTLSASTIYPGQSVSATWTTQRPSSCAGVASALTGPSAYVSGYVGGSATLTP